jgi:NAD(P)H-nitrite reductase large subunit
MNMISPRRTRLVLVGNGMGGVRALEEILARAPHEFAITVFGAEPHGNYNRIMLSPVLTGEKTFEAITTHPRSWYDDNDIELIAGESVVGIDRAAKTAIGALGTARSYDVLILATGSNPIIIPVPDHTLSGVIGFRDTADVEAMLAASRSGKHAIVIGGGLLGLEFLEYAAAFMQLYREEAWYLERTARWIERVGIGSIRIRLSDADERKRLQQRFLESQRHMQDDPWAERAAGAEAYEFRPLATME